MSLLGHMARRERLRRHRGPVCTEPHPSVMPRWNRLSWRDDRLFCFALAVLTSSFRSSYGLKLRTRLRHQLIVLRRRSRGRVRLTNHDRGLFIQLFHWFPATLKVFAIIRPETLVHWHRVGFRRYGALEVVPTEGDRRSKRSCAS
jgi:hypothetical protein